jgi:hypothetical protein
VTDRLFSLGRDGKLQRLERRRYTDEGILQRLLAQYPDLLAGDEMAGDVPRRWLLVARECGVPGEEGGPERWALDHLFIDQDGVPTLVEVKLSSDSRIRREVVGQMLDYAANGVAYWPVERLRQRLSDRCAREGGDPNQLVAALVGAEATEAVERFWSQVKTNLEAGKVRMVFLADEIPLELRRTVEFLNSQMDPAEVLAVEVRQFVGEHHDTLVPSVIGQTMAARRKKDSGREPGEKWTAERYFSRLQANRGDVVADAVRDLLAWITPLVTRVWWGEGKRDGSFVPILELDGGRSRGGQNVHFFVPWTYGAMEMQLQSLKEKPGFIDEPARREFVRRLNAVPGIVIPDDSIDRRPSFPLESLTDAETRAGFKRVIEWALAQVRAHTDVAPASGDGPVGTPSVPTPFG